LFTTKKIATVSVINDLVTDSRVNKTCKVLLESGYRVLLIGRKLPESRDLPDWPFEAFRMKLLFTKGPLFYLFFNLRLFLKLLFTKSDLLFSNDLDTLLPNYLVARIKKIPLIYDSHELFCEVPELVNSPGKKSIWEWLERKIVPQLSICITVNESIAEIFEKKYKVKFHVIRNIPEEVAGIEALSRAALDLPEDKKIIVLQGAGINIDRGAEELVAAMQLVEGVILLIIGGGDVWSVLQQKVEDLQLQDKVKLIAKLPKAKMMQYTLNADLGLSIDKNTNLNYLYSLPNKIFDYLHAGVPVLASRLPEIEHIINKYKVGWFISSHQPEHIASAIKQIFDSGELTAFKRNTLIAARELSWQTEKEKYLEIIRQVQH
jgi:glycosyltransferase involved in cell wall biosynthesis